ncbi:MAG TPA: SufS family cysteine desulfurase [Gemmataceae bacterium]|nr:SufS family cysteine desulfurase [Gemmataceae bacterium]
MSILPPYEPRPQAHSKALPPLFDLRKVRDDFPILQRTAHGKPLVYFDNAATTQKPAAVIDALRRYYELYNANIHRAVHLLSQLATREYEEARVKVQRFLNAPSAREVLFTRGTTEGINLVAQTYGRANLRPGDELIVSHMEHHSNIVPWQMLCEEKGARLRVVPIDDRGEFVFEEYEKLLGPRTKLVSVVHVSNSLGTVNPVKRIIEAAHRRGVPVMIDGAQAVAHLRVDLQELDCDFYALSGHKLYGPTGIGVLFGKERHLRAMPPYQGGGDMIASVTFEKTTYADLPNKFEAGTPDIAGAIGLAAAIDYVESLGLENIAAHEDKLLRYATEKVRQIPGVRILGTAAHKVGVLSFIVEDPPLSALDVGIKLDLEGVAVRTGHHCCQPVMDRFRIPGTARASFAMYNTTEEIDHFAATLRRIVAEATAKARPTTAAPPVEASYAKAAATSPQEAADKLADVFEFLDDWSERYAHILELGKKIPPMPPALKTEGNRVHGCQSTVHISARKKPGSDDVLEFVADSDADLVRGLIGVLERVYSGQRAEDILAFDVEGFFARLGLDQHLTMGRRNGLAAMVQRVRALAATLAPPQPAAAK